MIACLPAPLFIHSDPEQRYRADRSLCCVVAADEHCDILIKTPLYSDMSLLSTLIHLNPSGNGNTHSGEMPDARRKKRGHLLDCRGVFICGCKKKRQLWRLLNDIWPNMRLRETPHQRGPKDNTSSRISFTWPTVVSECLFSAHPSQHGPSPQGQLMFARAPASLSVLKMSFGSLKFVRFQCFLLALCLSLGGRAQQM